MKKFTTAWWKNLSEEDEIHATLKKINFILQYTGKWNRKARVLEVQCGLGSMPQFMSDNGYSFYQGIDNDEKVSELWENPETLTVSEPDSTTFDDKEFHLVCWFSMNDGRIEQDRIPDVLDEMDRIGHGAIILQPFERREKKSDTEFLGFMLANGWVCSDVNPVNWHYLFHRG